MAEIYNFNDEVSAALGESRHPIEYLEPRRIEFPDTFPATAWVVNGVIPEGIGVISGSGGVGKTSSIVPLALAVAGFKSPACDLEIELPRNIIYITEDEGQVIQILHGMRDFLKWDDETWADVKSKFKIFSSKRVDHITIELMLNEIMPYSVVDPIFSTPLVIFDTASANFDLENESSNSEASLFMSVLKNFYSKTKTSMWVIAHLNKIAKGMDIDSMINATARGAGSWGDDAMWTAILGTTEEDNKGDRILKMGKVRAALSFNEIMFKNTVQQIAAINRFGKTVMVDYRYSVPNRSSFESRFSQEHQKRCDELEAQIIQAVSELEYPSKKDIKEHINADVTLVHKLINHMLQVSVLEECVLPEGKSRGNKKNYIALANKISTDLDF
jgi:RecA-family ATPase